MIKYLPILFVSVVPLTTPCRAGAPIERKVEFTDQQFREAVKSFFLAERQKQESHFSRLKITFLDDPERVEFGKHWDDNPGFNFFIIDRKKMKYEYNYMIGNSGIKIYGDIKKQGIGLQCNEPRVIKFMHINRG